MKRNRLVLLFSIICYFALSVFGYVKIHNENFLSQQSKAYTYNELEGSMIEDETEDIYHAAKLDASCD